MPSTVKAGDTAVKRPVKKPGVQHVCKRRARSRSILFIVFPDLAKYLAQGGGAIKFC